MMNDFYDLTPEAKEARTITKDWDVTVVNKQLETDIRLLVNHIGHTVPMPMNTIITAKFYNNCDMQVFDKIEVEDSDWQEIEKHKAHILPGTKGIIVEHTWHIDAHSLSYAKISNKNLLGAQAELWYLVKFSVGRYWVRFDWIEPYSTPVK